MNWFKSLAIAASACLAVAGLSTASTAQAQTYPNRPVRLVVPYAAGGGTDLLARYVAERLSKRIAQPVVVDNRPGANGLIGAKFVSDSAPDGNTLVMVTPGWPATPVFVKASPVEVPQGLVPVALLAEGRFVLAAGAGAPFATFRDFVAYGKANPGKINYASGGVGDALLLMENVRISNHFDMARINYPGGARTITALLSDEVHLAIVPENIARGHAATGKMRILAVSGAQRSPGLADVPTFAELGFPAGRNNWFALMAARGTQRLPRLVGAGRATDLILTGDAIDASQALQWGVLQRVFAPEVFETEVLALATRMAAGAPVATRYTKEAVLQGLDMPLEQALRMELDLYLLLFDTADRREGITAFQERRAPRFEGR